VCFVCVLRVCVCVCVCVCADSAFESQCKLRIMLSGSLLYRVNTKTLLDFK